MEFIQIIEFTTTRFDEVEAVMNEWVTKTEGKRTASRGTLTTDRDKPNTYVQIVEFPSYQQAMDNSNLPETAEVAEKMAKLCEGPATFRNLNVRRVDELR
jgi:quinol monooxygenase YgiN